MSLSLATANPLTHSLMIGHGLMIAFKVVRDFLPEFVERLGIRTIGMVVRTSRTCVEFTSAALCCRAFGAGNADVAREARVAHSDGLHVESKQERQAMQFVLGAVAAGNQADHVAFGQCEITSQLPALLLFEGSDMMDRRPTGAPRLQDVWKAHGPTSDPNYNLLKLCRTENSAALL